MCRSIRTLYNLDPPCLDEEVRAAALQYVRKTSGHARPSAANAEAFARAVDEIAAATSSLLRSMVTSAAPRSREAEAARALARARSRTRGPDSNGSAQR